MPVDEFGLTGEDREIQRRRRMVLAMRDRLPRAAPWWQKICQRLRKLFRGTP